MREAKWNPLVGIIDMIGYLYQEGARGKHRKRRRSNRRLIDRVRDPFSVRTYLGMNTY